MNSTHFITAPAPLYASSEWKKTTIFWDFFKKKKIEKHRNRIWPIYPTAPQIWTANLRIPKRDFFWRNFFFRFQRFRWCFRNLSYKLPLILIYCANSWIKAHDGRNSIFAVRFLDPVQLGCPVSGAEVQGTSSKNWRCALDLCPSYRTS